MRQRLEAAAQIEILAPDCRPAPSARRSGCRRRARAPRRGPSARWRCRAGGNAGSTNKSCRKITGPFQPVMTRALHVAMPITPEKSPRRRRREAGIGAETVAQPIGFAGAHRVQGILALRQQALQSHQRRDVGWAVPGARETGRNADFSSSWLRTLMRDVDSCLPILPVGSAPSPLEPAASTSVERIGRRHMVRQQ